MTSQIQKTQRSNQCTIIARCIPCGWQETFTWVAYGHGDHLAHAMNQASYHTSSHELPPVSDGPLSLPLSDRPLPSPVKHHTTLQTIECFDGPGIEDALRASQAETLAEKSLILMEDEDLRKKEFERVMLWRQTLTPAGLGWESPTDGRYRYLLPISEDEKRSYQEQRETLGRQLPTGGECEDDQYTEHQGQIQLALRYLSYCNYSTGRKSTGRKAGGRNSGTTAPHSNQVRISAQKLGSPGFISSGAMIAAALMANAKITQVKTGRVLEPGARIHIDEPRPCGDRRFETNHFEIAERETRKPREPKTRGCRNNLIPAGSRKRLCDECRGVTA